MMMMMVLCQKAGSLAFTPPGDEMTEVVSRCLPHRQLWVSNLSKVSSEEVLKLSFMGIFSYCFSNLELGN